MEIEYDIPLSECDGNEWAGSYAMLHWDFTPKIALYKNQQGCWHAEVTYNAYGHTYNETKKRPLCTGKTIDVVVNGPGKNKALKKIRREVWRLNRYYLQMIKKMYI